MSDNIHGTFISEKVSKIRWKPEDFSEAKSFLTGSWDNPVKLRFYINAHADQLLKLPNTR